MKWTFFLALAALLLTKAKAQDHLALDPDGQPPKWLEVRARISGPADVTRNERTVLERLWHEGYLEASIDSCVSDSIEVRCGLHLGPVYRWARLSMSGVDGAIASDARLRERYFRGQPLDPVQVGRSFETLLDRCENIGYPFAAVRLDSLVASGNGLIARVVLDKGRLTRIDSVVVRGTARVSERYLQAQIGIRPGDPYREELIVGAEQRLRELPFVAQRQRPYVLFTPEKTKLYLFLDQKKASSINGILGVAPDPDGKVNFTGDLDLRLRNALRHGEAIELNWRSLKDKSQDLKVRLNYPCLFQTPFGTDLSLKLFKRDTTFLEVTMRAALEYLLGRNDRVSVFVNDKSSSRLGRSELAQPGLADVDLTSYGLGFERDRFDHRYNPRSGFGIATEGSAGRKRSVEGNIQGDAPPEKITTTQYELTGHVAGHLRVGGRGTVRIAGQGGSMVNERLFTNELFRIGGIKDLRGVDEASIYASSFAVATVELRFILEENSNAFIFFDQAWWEDQSQEVLITDTPLGFGVGTSFETKAGIFSLTYALGQQRGSPIDLRESKVHFGFTSLF